MRTKAISSGDVQRMDEATSCRSTRQITESSSYLVYPPPSDRGVVFFGEQIKNLEIQPTSLLDLARAVVAAPAAGLVEI